MLPIKRRKQIEEVIREKKHLKISDLSHMFQVSEMTIHRDLAPLIDDGKIIKTFGGVTCAHSLLREEKNTCIYCHKEYQEHLANRIILKDGTREMACCSHCALLRYYQIEPQISQILGRDFLKQTTINVKHAHFVLNTSLNIGCCQPQVLTFEEKEHAQKFVKGFSGDIHPFEEAVKLVFKQMT